MAAFGPTMTWGFGCISVAVGVAAGGFALTARHFFQTPKKYPKRLAPAFGPRRLGFLRSGTDPGAAATVCFAAPPSAVSGCARRSLRSHAQINPSTQPFRRRRWIKIKSRRADTRPLSGEKRGCSAFDLCCCCPSPQPSPEGEGADFGRSKICIRLGIASRRISPEHLGQSPLPPGEG
ncbi:hypothetical protein DMX03_14035 [Pseudomonas koreensis]|nr:hypothetical protein DMX03_14035 [Pseudomonas koreensis]